MKANSKRKFSCYLISIDDDLVRFVVNDGEESQERFSRSSWLLELLEKTQVLLPGQCFEISLEVKISSAKIKKPSTKNLLTEEQKKIFKDWKIDD